LQRLAYREARAMELRRHGPWCFTAERWITDGRAAVEIDL
jgi:hypothetical protein